MKKILLSIAVAGLFLATGCSKSPVDKAVDLCDEYAAKIDKAADCEEAVEILQELGAKIQGMEDDVDQDKVTDEEKQRLYEAGEKVGLAYGKKCANELSNF